MTDVVIPGLGVLCGVDPPVDGEWHLLSYAEEVTHKCAQCSMCANYVKLTETTTPKGRRSVRSLYVCREHKPA